MDGREAVGSRCRITHTLNEGTSVSDISASDVDIRNDHDNVDGFRNTTQLPRQQIRSEACIAVASSYVQRRFQMIRFTNCQRCGNSTVLGEVCAKCFFAEPAEAVDNTQGVSLSRFLEPKVPTFKQRSLTPEQRRARFRTIVGGKK